MPDMKITLDRITKEIVMSVLYLFSFTPATVQLKPVALSVRKNGNKLLNRL
jgi:hypothetical protein